MEPHEIQEAGNIQRRLRAADGRPESTQMGEFDRQFLELKKEVVEARNLVIKNDNILKNLNADLRNVLERQKAFERRSAWTSASAYLIFAALAIVGAFKYASSEIREKTAAAVTEHLAREKAEALLKQKDDEITDARAESAKALALFQELSTNDESKRSKALNEVASMQPKFLTDLEKAALKDKSLSLRIAAAQSAYDDAREEFNRRDYREAVASLTQYLKLATKPDANAYNLLGNAYYSIHDYKDAVEPLRTYLKSGPGTKTAEYTTLLLGDSLSSSGQVKEAIQVYRQGGARFGASETASAMRHRARRLEKALKDASANKPH